MEPQKRVYNGVYTGDRLAHIAFPLGGIGAGMLCLEGAGALSHVSLRGQPDVFNEPLLFSALCVKGQPNIPRVLEGPVPAWKVFFPWAGSAGSGGSGKDYGLPRFAAARFLARFPFATVELDDPNVPLAVEITGWSPFIPGDPGRSGLPAAALEYRFANRSGRPVEAVYSFHARNFMATGSPGQAVLLQDALQAEMGFTLFQAGSQEKPWEQGAFSATTGDPAAVVNCAWFRGGWWDSLTMAWKSVRDGEAIDAGPVTAGDPSPGGSLYAPFCLEPGEEKTVVLRLAWHVPETDMRYGKDPAGAAQEPCCADGERPANYKPWYAGVYGDIGAVTRAWAGQYDELRRESAAFRDCFYSSTLPPEVLEAVSANLAILKTPTALRQADGRFWAWEGCSDARGCCHGSCTHVWNYAQALPHLFPQLERSLRETEFAVAQDDFGHQDFRVSLPIRPTTHDFHAASDGQLGGIMKAHREWRVSGDTEWLRRLWPRIRQSLSYCIETWDPDHTGTLVEPHHNTYDIEFWGPDGMCTSFYLGALTAAIAMAQAVGGRAAEDDVALYKEFLSKGLARMQSQLWNGEYFFQQVQWEGLRAGDPRKAPAMSTSYSPEAVEVLKREGPKYQYGTGCLSDGVLGAWIAAMCGVGDFLDREKVESHLLAVFCHNFRRDLAQHSNPQRPTYALGHDGGLLVCSWPGGDALSLPFPYSNEVWTGIEYHVASHLMMLGHVEEGLEIVRTARDRYDGRVRDPFDEYECGHWYARALSSYGLLQGLTGIRYDAVERTLYMRPSMAGDFRSFLSTATGYGNAGVRDGQPFVEVVRGAIDCAKIVYEPAS